MPASLASRAVTPEIQPEGLGNAVSSGGSGLTRSPNVFVLQTAKKVFSFTAMTDIGSVH